jgi:hypothetical protein
MATENVIMAMVSRWKWIPINFIVHNWIICYELWFIVTENTYFFTNLKTFFCARVSESYLDISHLDLCLTDEIV